jgi:hypothetical protein
MSNPDLVDLTWRVGLKVLETVLHSVRGGADLEQIILLDAIGRESVTEIVRALADDEARKKFTTET